MKNKRWLALLLVLVLSSCIDGATDSSSSDSSSGTTDTTSASESSATTTASESSSTTQSETSSDSSSSDPRPTSGTQAIDLYAINDFHGAVSYDPSNDEPGLARVAKYLKTKRDAKPDETIFLASGDMWQGSIDSNYNRGHLLTETMNDIGFEAMTIGNHEFDWGSQYIGENAALADFPILGANIMQYPDTSSKSSIGEEYAIVERGYLKIGIIGVIGANQITSITSAFVQNVYFAEPTEIIKDLSDELKNEQGCDVVVLSIHSGQDDVDTSIPYGGYVDAVFCAHTHQDEMQLIEGVPFIQGGSNGRYVSNVKLSYDFATDEVSYVSYGNTSEGALSSLSVDVAVQSIIDQYALVSDPIKNENLGTLSGTLSSGSTLPNMANYAAAVKAEELGYDIDFAMTNVARSSVYAGSIVYGALFKALPFDNYVIIIEATGYDIKREANYNYAYRVSDYSSIDDDVKYTIAVIDYLAYHQNVYKEYDYFESFDPTTDYVGALTIGGEPLYPRDLVADLFRASGTIDASDYTGDRYDNLTA